MRYWGESGVLVALHNHVFSLFVCAWDVYIVYWLITRALPCTIDVGYIHMIYLILFCFPSSFRLCSDTLLLCDDQGWMNKLRLSGIARR